MPIELTLSIATKLIDAVRNGLYLDAAADLAGVAPRLVRRWLRRGQREGSGPYHLLSLALDEAEARLQQELLEGIRQAADRSGAARTWLAEHRYPHWYGPMAREILALVQPATRDQEQSDDTQRSR